MAHLGEFTPNIYYKSPITSRGSFRARLRAVVRVKGAGPLPMSPVRPTCHNEMMSQHQPYNNEGQPQRLDHSPQPCAMQRLVGSQKKPQAVFEICHLNPRNSR